MMIADDDEGEDDGEDLRFAICDLRFSNPRPVRLVIG